MKTYEPNWRFSVMGALAFVLPILIAAQVVRIQTNPEQIEKIIQESEGYSKERRTIVPARGQIYDRWGNLLAGNRTIYEIGAELQFVKNPETIAQTLNAILGVD